MGSRPSVLDGAALVGPAPRPGRGLLARLARRPMGPARRRCGVRDAPGRGRDVLRAPLSAELVAARDADLPRAGGRLPRGVPVPGGGPHPPPDFTRATAGRADARAGGGHRHARRRGEGERPDDAGERILGRAGAHRAGRCLGHAPRRQVLERGDPGRDRTRVRAHRAPPPLEGAGLGGAVHVPDRAAGSATRASCPTARSSSCF